MGINASKSVDVVGLADVFAMLDVEPNDFSIPNRLSKLQDISAYFSGKANATSQVLRILAKDRRSDKLDAAWMWVRLQQEKEQTLQKLDPKDFTDDIADELKRGFLSKEKHNQLKQQIKIEKEKARKEAEKERLMAQDERQYQQKVAQSTKQALTKGLVERTDNVLAELEAIQKELAPYDD